jgi:hypothetical protein
VPGAGSGNRAADRARPAEHPARVAASIGWASRLSSRLGRTTTACCPIAGCTTDADLAAALFPDGALLDRALQPGYVRLSSTDDERNPACVVRSGSIRVLRIDQVARDARQWPACGPAGGQLKLPKQRRKLGLRGLVGGPRTKGPRNGPSSTALMLAHDSIATNAPLTRAFAVERVTRIELAWPAWKYSTPSGCSRTVAGRPYSE